MLVGGPCSNEPAKAAILQVLTLYASSASRPTTSPVRKTTTHCDYAPFNTFTNGRLSAPADVGT